MLETLRDNSKVGSQVGGAAIGSVMSKPEVLQGCVLMGMRFKKGWEGPERKTRVREAEEEAEEEIYPAHSWPLSWQHISHAAIFRDPFLPR